MMALDSTRCLRLGHATATLSSIKEKNAAFAAAENFFSLPSGDKEAWMAPFAEERGYRRSNAHTEVFIVRGEKVPAAILPVLPYWRQCQALASKCLVDIAAHLNLPSENFLSLTDFNSVADKQLSPSCMRILRYAGRDTRDDCQRALPMHVDVGLLSIIPRSTNPALQVIDMTDFSLRDAEELLTDRQCLVIGGATLSYVTNNMFLSCHHAVKATKLPRLSVVYQLRPTGTAQLTSSSFTSKETGAFGRPFSRTAATFINEEKRLRSSVSLPH